MRPHLPVTRFHSVLALAGVLSLSACGKDDDGGGGGGGDAGDSGAGGDDTGGGAVCDNVAAPGYYCMTSGCPGGEDWGYNVDYVAEGGAGTAEVALANSGGGGLDWVVSITAGTTVISAYVPAATTSVVVTKLPSDDIVADFQAGEPFFGAWYSPDLAGDVTSAELSVEVGAGCDTFQATWTLTPDAGDPLTGTLSASRQCGACE